MKYFVYQAILVFLVTTNIYANNQLDSLRQISIKQTGREKLETLHRIISTMSTNDALIVEIEQLLHSSMEQSDYLYVASAYEHLVHHYHYSRSQEDSAMVYVDKGLEALKKIDRKKIEKTSDKAMYDKTIIMLNHLQVIILVKKRNYVLALKLVQDFLGDTKDEKNPMFKKYIYYQLGLIHATIGNGKESIKSYSKSLKYGTVGSSSYELLPTLYAQYGIVEGYSLQKNDDKVIAWCDTIMQYCIDNQESLSKSKSYKLLGNGFKLDRYYAYSYISKNDMQKAKEYLDKCDAAFPVLHKVHIPMYYELKAFYYLKNNKYELADQYINKAIEELDTDVYSSRELYFFLMKADILKEWGKSEEAYDLLKNTYELNDSINKNDLKGQIAAIESIYKVHGLETELQLQDIRLNQFRITLAASLVIIILIMIILFITRRNYKKLNERNKDLYKSHKKAQEIYKENENLRLEKMLLKKGADPDEIIIQKLDNYMKETKIYLDPNVTRDIVASKIQTNRQYLLDAIRTKRKQSFNEYIYILRLQNAYNQVVNNQEVSILEIFEHSGFANRSVFNKEFKREYGMTPSELRAIAKDVEETAD